MIKKERERAGERDKEIERGGKKERGNQKILFNFFPSFLIVQIPISWKISHN
jgi:hypothetical protein